MTNVLRIDFEKKLIIMDRTFSMNCRNTASDEYAQLQNVRRDYPTYRVETRQIKKNPKKKTYKGLTYEYMEDYILMHEVGEARREVLAEFHEMQIISECHSKAYRYPVIKNWFLSRYPEIVDFGTKSEEVVETPSVVEIQQQDLPIAG